MKKSKRRTDFQVRPAWIDTSPQGTPGDVIATMYHTLGIPANTTVTDHKGRPIYIYNGEPIRALL